MASFGIFPVSVYGQASDVFGTAVTAYANTNGVPPGSGLVLGQFVQLFDGTVVRLLKASAGISQYSACVMNIGNSNDYTVTQAPATANTPIVVAISDRAGATALVANNYAWMTVYGNATANVVTGVTAPSLLTTSGTTSGQLIAATVGTSANANLIAVNTTVSSGANPIIIR